MCLLIPASHPGKQEDDWLLLFKVQMQNGLLLVLLAAIISEGSNIAIRK